LFFRAIGEVTLLALTLGKSLETRANALFPASGIFSASGADPQVVALPFPREKGPFESFAVPFTTAFLEFSGLLVG